MLPSYQTIEPREEPLKTCWLVRLEIEWRSRNPTGNKCIADRFTMVDPRHLVGKSNVVLAYQVEYRKQDLLDEEVLLEQALEGYSKSKAKQRSIV